MHVPLCIEVRLHGTAALFLERFGRHFEWVYREQRELTRRRGLIAVLLGTGGSLGYAAFYACAIGLTGRHALSIGQLTMYVGAFASVQNELSVGSRRIGSLFQHSLFISNFVEFLHTKPTVISPRRPTPCRLEWSDGIRLENVSFRYAPATPWVLRNVDLRLRAGEYVTLVGANGAGKTTLVKLLCRLYDPTEGRILIDGIDLRDLSLTDYQSRIGVVFQDPARYQMLAWENIAMGRLSESSNMPRIVAAAEASGIDRTILRLPAGFQTLLGTYFEGGHELSHGEWQMIGISRALIRDAQLVVFDEPTAALDPARESDMLLRFGELARGRIALVISHRLSTAVRADRVIVLKNGQVLEDGRHDDLMRVNGVYRHLFLLQASRYKSEVPAALS